MTRLDREQITDRLVEAAERYGKVRQEALDLKAKVRPCEKLVQAAYATPCWAESVYDGPESARHLLPEERCATCREAMPVVERLHELRRSFGGLSSSLLRYARMLAKLRNLDTSADI